jgi:hypothetical protein
MQRLDDVAAAVRFDPRPHGWLRVAHFGHSSHLTAYVAGSIYASRMSVWAETESSHGRERVGDLGGVLRAPGPFPAVPQSTAAYSPSGLSVGSAAVVPATPAETSTDDTQVAEQPAADAIEVAAPTAPSLASPWRASAGSEKPHERLSTNKGFPCITAQGFPYVTSSSGQVPISVRCSSSPAMPT